MSIAGTEGINSMTPPPPPPIPGTTPGNGLSNTLSSTSSKEKDMFLKLLAAQMKYQDPMKPTDSSQFLSQSAQFTSLEKMQSVADQTGALVGAQMAFGASSLVGRSVSYALADGTSGTGTVSGVSFGSTGPVLNVGAAQVPIASVLSVTAGDPA